MTTYLLPVNPKETSTWFTPMTVTKLRYSSGTLAHGGSVSSTETGFMCYIPTKIPKRGQFVSMTLRSRVYVLDSITIHEWNPNTAIKTAFLYENDEVSMPQSHELDEDGDFKVTFTKDVKALIVYMEGSIAIENNRFKRPYTQIVDIEHNIENLRNIPLGSEHGTGNTFVKSTTADDGVILRAITDDLMLYPFYSLYPDSYGSYITHTNTQLINKLVDNIFSPSMVKTSGLNFRLTRLDGSISVGPTAMVYKAFYMLLATPPEYPAVEPAFPGEKAPAVKVESRSKMNPITSRTTYSAAAKTTSSIQPISVRVEASKRVKQKERSYMLPPESSVRVVSRIKGRLEIKSRLESITASVSAKAATSAKSFMRSITSRSIASQKREVTSSMRPITSHVVAHKRSFIRIASHINAMAPRQAQKAKTATKSHVKPIGSYNERYVHARRTVSSHTKPVISRVRSSYVLLPMKKRIEIRSFIRPFGVRSLEEKRGSDLMRLNELKLRLQVPAEDTSKDEYLLVFLDDALDFVQRTCNQEFELFPPTAKKVVAHYVAFELKGQGMVLSESIAGMSQTFESSEQRDKSLTNMLRKAGLIRLRFVGKGR